MSILLIVVNSVAAGIALEQIRFMENPVFRCAWGMILFLSIFTGFIYVRKAPTK